MQAEFHSWERSLLSRALEAYHSQAHTELPTADRSSLDAAYLHCEGVTARNSRSFHLASSLLPREKRRAARALYAFCRVTDDLIDSSAGEDRLVALEAWRRTLLAGQIPQDDLVAQAWSDARRRFVIPVLYAEQLLDGVARDTRQNRYETFDDLASYSYGVASTVGLMSMHIIGFSGPEAVPYAIKLGVALQLTNILRDVGEDWRNGRLYIPQEDLRHFGISEEQIDVGVTTGLMPPRWGELMAAQIERTRRLYEEAWPGICMLAGDGRLAIAAAADLYRGILRAIERNHYDNLTRRASVSAAEKLAMLPAIWWRLRRAVRQNS